MGFSCRVIANIENDVVKEGITVPLSAVVFDNTLNSKKYLFIIHPHRKWNNAKSTIRVLLLDVMT